MKANKLIEYLGKMGLDFYTGVPDSLLKELIIEIDCSISEENHIIACNEGQSISISEGYYLQTGSPGVVYMQNSGIGNAVNPLLSMASNRVYSIPLLMIIGWRAELGVKDEPQHKHQGEVSKELLKVMDIPYLIIDSLTDIEILSSLIIKMIAESRPVALLVKKNTFETDKTKNKIEVNSALKRIDIIEKLIDKIKSPIVSTTGHTSRELFDLREKKKQSHNSDFLSVGGMGHAISIAIGIASKRAGDVYCFDGDGAFLMHMGSASIIKSTKIKGNIKHIVFDNHCHLSVGGFATSSKNLDMRKIAEGLGYSRYFEINNENELSKIEEFCKTNEHAILVVKVSDLSEKDLSRPNKTTKICKHEFSEFLIGNNVLFGDVNNNLKLINRDNTLGKILIIAGNGSGLLENFCTEQTDFIIFNDYTPNPDISEIYAAIEIFEKNKCTSIIAIGGGTAIDIAKLVKEKINKSIELTVIPTTCGSGAEITPFAVCYKNGVKDSFATQIPDNIILDKTILESTPLKILNAPIADALVQAIESIWSVNSTNKSNNYAIKAISYILKGINFENNQFDYEALQIGSFLAGKAISISKTTACHALSYGLTSLYKIRHGEAVSMLLPFFIKLHYENGDDKVLKKLEKIFSSFDVDGIDDFLNKYSKVIDKLKLKSNLEKIDIEELGRLVNADRLSNNPVKLSDKDIADAYSGLLN